MDQTFCHRERRMLGDVDDEMTLGVPAAFAKKSAAAAKCVCRGGRVPGECDPVQKHGGSHHVPVRDALQYRFDFPSPNVSVEEVDGLETVERRRGAREPLRDGFIRRKDRSS